MKKQSLNLSSFVTIILFIFSFAYSSEKNIAIGKASIIDGDTIKISGETIRFAGIDTPEKNKIGHEFSKQKLKQKIGNNIVGVSFSNAQMRQRALFNQVLGNTKREFFGFNSRTENIIGKAFNRFVEKQIRATRI